MADQAALVALFKAQSLHLALAESCTGGLVASGLASIPGASEVLWGSFVTYTVSAKVRMLGIEPDFIARYGAVSEETALAMALGAKEKSGAEYGLSVTGLAGPGGDGSGLPVGTVWMGLALPGGGTEARRFQYTGGRNDIRGAAASGAVHILFEAASRLLTDRGGRDILIKG
ncbi:MAG: nicotinamide-nucleotide amidohydrolase family protein [Spirochaetaceae bacterium]|jgi:PncC family amidohydrolase|nr:nicotinamide-nucleotide amidohydrolase family protein [Spirochaetaceae bacterium]